MWLLNFYRSALVANMQQIVSAHMDELLKFPTCNGDCVSFLRYVHDKILVHIRSLKSVWQLTDTRSHVQVTKRS